MSYDSDEKQLVMELKQRFPDQIQAIDAKELHYVLLGLDPDFPEQIESIMHFRRTRVEYWRRFHQVPSHQWEWGLALIYMEVALHDDPFCDPAWLTQWENEYPDQIADIQHEEIGFVVSGRAPGYPKTVFEIRRLQKQYFERFHECFPPGWGHLNQRKWLEDCLAAGVPFRGLRKNEPVFLF